MSKTLLWTTFWFTLKRNGIGSFLNHFALKSQITGFPRLVFILFKLCICEKFIKLLLASITESLILCYFFLALSLLSIYWFLNPCRGLKQMRENQTSSCLTALMLEKELIQVTTHNFCKNEVITPVKKFLFLFMKAVQSINHAGTLEEQIQIYSKDLLV